MLLYLCSFGPDDELDAESAVIGLSTLLQRSAFPESLKHKQQLSIPNKTVSDGEYEYIKERGIVRVFENHFPGDSERPTRVVDRIDPVQGDVGLYWFHPDFLDVYREHNTVEERALPD